MKKLTKYEQETIILMNRAEPEVMIYTYEPKLKMRMKGYTYQQETTRQERQHIVLCNLSLRQPGAR